MMSDPNTIPNGPKIGPHTGPATVMTGSRTGRPGSYTVEQSTSIISHTPDGDRIMIARRDVQPDAPISTVLVRESVMVLGDIVLLGVGCRAAAPHLQGDQREWVEGIVRAAKEMAHDMIDGIVMDLPDDDVDIVDDNDDVLGSYGV